MARWLENERKVGGAGRLLPGTLRRVFEKMLVGSSLGQVGGHMSNRARAAFAKSALPAVSFVIVVAVGCGGGGAHPITEFALPAISSNPIGITAGPDGTAFRNR